MLAVLKLVYWVTAPAGLLLFAAAALDLPLSLAGRRFRLPAWRVSPGGDLALLALALFLFQWPVWRFEQPLDPDESQFLAGAITLHADPVFWRSVDGETAGPLVYYSLWLLAPLGAAGYGAARVVEVVLLFGTLALSYLGCRRVWGDGLARLALLPASVFFILLEHPRLVHFCSEHVALPLLALAVYGLLSGFAGDARPEWETRSWLLAGLGLGAIPFAKLQAVAPAAALFAVAIVWIAGQRDRATGWHRRTLLALAGGLLAVPLAFAAMLTVAGEWREFLLSYLAQNLVYTRGGWGNLHDALAGIGLMLTSVPSFTCLALGSAVVVLGPGRSPRVWRGAARWPLLLLLTWTVVTVPVCLGTRAYLHYLLFLVMPMTLLAGGILATVWQLPMPAGVPDRRRRTALAGLALIVGPQLIIRAGTSSAYLADAQPGPQPDQRSVIQVTEIIQHASAPGDRLTIWGWWDEPYVLTGLAQGTRHSNTDMLTMPGPYLEHLRQRYLSDLRTRRPRFFVDASEHGRGGMAHSGRQRLKSEMFPALRDYVAANYALVADVDGTKVYRRKEP